MGKLAARALRDRYGKGFPADLVERTRNMFTVHGFAKSLEDLRFPPGNYLERPVGKSGLLSGPARTQFRPRFRFETWAIVARRPRIFRYSFGAFGESEC